jgi:DNA-binding transcriptional LysR family regulator
MLAARAAAVTLSSRLRICGPLTFTRLLVMPRLSIFLVEHPALDIDVVLEDRDIDLIAAGIDVALLIGRLADSAATLAKSDSAKGGDRDARLFRGKGRATNPRLCELCRKPDVDQWIQRLRVDPASSRDGGILKTNSAQAQCVRNDQHGAHAHRRARNHRVEQ